MIGFDKWYRFIDKNDKRLFLDYFKYLRANQIGRYVDELDENYPSEFLNAECLKIAIDNGYHINYITKYNPEFMRIIEFGYNEREFILRELYKQKGDNKMVECYKETAIVRSIMEREYNREMRELEDKRNKLVDEAYLKNPIGEQAQLLATLIEANTTLKVDFKNFLTLDVMPLCVQREIEQIKENFSKEANKLAIKYQNLEAMLSICETYEQKEKLLKKNHII